MSTTDHFRCWKESDRGTLFVEDQKGLWSGFTFWKPRHWFAWWGTRLTGNIVFLEFE